MVEISRGVDDESAVINVLYDIGVEALRIESRREMA
jgi:hypothetical protein